MKITVTAAEPKDNKLEATLTVAAADVDAAIKKAYKDIANKYRFQGFRKGKAPRPVIDGLVGKDNVLAEASEDVLNEATPLMLDELDIVPVGQPTYGDEPVLVSEGSDYVVTATISLRPDCELESYDAPEINMPPAEVTEAEVAEQLETLVNYHATYEDAGDDFAASEGDMLTLDIENVENGEDLAGTDRPFMIGSSTVPAAFNDAIKGMKVGETKDVEISIEGDEPKTVKVKVTLKSAKKQVVPELDDELAKKGFGYDTVDALKDALKEEIAEDKKAQLPNIKETRVIEKLAESLKLDELPEDYVKQIFDEIAQDFLGQLQRQGLTLDAWLSARRIQINDFLEDLNAQAAERARQSLALDALAKKLGLEATEEDVRKEFEDAGVKDVDASMKEFKDAGRMPAVRETVKRSKAVNWLVENAKVTEVDEIAERRAAREAAKDAE
ncbi:trigger factor [uncultured Parolsenella sp.]|uniref:trigger factor n=1 Tax=uncultured Parolsenella sp. TaxID=2083008 RepID=UPI0025F059A9|nr:trigger factor [uncultured Parolsenella sp.]